MHVDKGGAGTGADARCLLRPMVFVSRLVSFSWATRRMCQCWVLAITRNKKCEKKISRDGFPSQPCYVKKREPRHFQHMIPHVSCVSRLVQA